MKKVLLILMTISVLFIISCSDPEIYNSIDDLDSKTQKSLTQTFELDLNDSNTSYVFVTEAGCTVRFPSGKFSQNGNEVVGKINIDVIEIFDKGNMALTGMTTTSYFETLISGGEFFIRAYQDDNELDYDDFYAIKVPTSLTGGPSNEMMLFSRTFTDLDLGQTWSIAQDIPESMAITLSENQENYSITLRGFGWFNCDRFRNDPGKRITLDILTPAEFNEKNSVVYFAIKNETSSLSNAFNFPMPKGLEIHLIFIASSNEELLYEIISTTASDDLVYVFRQSKMQKASADELRDIINGLQ
ncbi:MAG: hypothetical protein AAGA77_03150 [Bacteroidota bacterium]